MTKKCKSCQSDIDAKAKKCPHCQADQRNWFRRHPVLTTILGLIILGIVIGESGKSSPSTPATNTQGDQAASTSTVAPTQPPMVMDATSLVGEYDKNKLAAQDKYTGRRIQTTAFIDNISSDITNNYYLSLKPSNDQYYGGTSIQCYFNDESQLTSLANGQSVTVTGTMQDMTLGIVEMKDCSIVK